MPLPTPGEIVHYRYGPHDNCAPHVIGQTRRAVVVKADAISGNLTLRVFAEQGDDHRGELARKQGAIEGARLRLPGCWFLSPAPKATPVATTTVAPEPLPVATTTRPVTTTTRTVAWPAGIKSAK